MVIKRSQQTARGSLSLKSPLCPKSYIIWKFEYIYFGIVIGLAFMGFWIILSIDKYQYEKDLKGINTKNE